MMCRRTRTHGDRTYDLAPNGSEHYFCDIVAAGDALFAVLLPHRSHNSQPTANSMNFDRLELVQELQLAILSLIFVISMSSAFQ